MISRLYECEIAFNHCARFCTFRLEWRRRDVHHILARAGLRRGLCPAAEGGIALVIAIGNLGGFLGPYMIGALKEQTGGYAASMAALAFAMLLSAVIVLTVGRAMTPRPSLGQTRGSHKGQESPNWA